MVVHERTTRGLAHKRALAVILFTSVVLFAAWWISTHSQESIEHTSSSAFVTRLYQQVLGRPPEPGSVDGWVRQIQEFGSVVPTILAFFHSPEFLSHKTTDDQYLTILYRALLRREPDPAGFAALLVELQAGRLTRDNLLDSFMDSQEFAAQVNFLSRHLAPLSTIVKSLYIRILRRPPDSHSFQTYVAQIQQNQTLLPTVLHFLASPEFQGRHTTNTEFVTLLYRTLLDRIPDASGLTSFVALLDNGAMTRTQLVLELAASSEFQAIEQKLFPNRPPSPPVPNTSGTYTISGTVTQSNCGSRRPHATFVLTGSTFTVTQVRANLSGTGRLVERVDGSRIRVDLVFSGTVNTAGQLSGTLTTLLFIDDVFDAGSTGTFSGSFKGNTITLAAPGQAIREMCTFTASLSGTR
jgi:hypothetical protein